MKGYSEEKGNNINAMYKWVHKVEFNNNLQQNNLFGFMIHSFNLIWRNLISEINEEAPHMWWQRKKYWDMKAQMKWWNNGDEKGMAQMDNSVSIQKDNKMKVTMM